MSHFLIEKESAEIWRRIAALVYDFFILVALSLVFFALALMIHSIFYSAPQEDYVPVLTSPVYPMAWYASLTFFFFYFWQKDGQTLGMRAWRLKLLGQDNLLATPRNCLIRALLSPTLVVIFLLPYIWKFFDKDNLCLHDRLSKTKVVVIKKVRE